MKSIVSRMAATAVWGDRSAVPSFGTSEAGVRLRLTPTGKPEGRPVRIR